jgi:phosphonoacetate hydrolase
MTTERAPADHVIVCVFDGLRPDMVTDALTPNLMRLARRGTWFREARSVFPSVTRVATSSVATGATPSVHGIVGNSFYFPEVAKDFVLDTGLREDILLAHAATGGQFLTAQTFGDRLAQAGKMFAVVHTGSGGSCYCINPQARKNGHWTFSMLGAHNTETPEAVTDIVKKLGPVPERELPRFNEMDYGARILTEHVLPVMKPDVALIWFNEPDTSYHYKFLGAPDTLAVLRHVDAAFGRILDWVDAQPDAERYAIIAASDHGQISTSGEIPLAALLSQQGHGAHKSSERTLEGSAIAFTGGTSGEIRVLDGDTKRRDAIARWLMEQDFVANVFSANHTAEQGVVPGTLPFSLVGVDHARAPDLMYTLASSTAPDVFGLPGLGLMTGGVPLGGGMHGALNRHELNTVLIGAGAGWGEGNRVTEVPAGIIDIGPTVLWLTGVSASATMMGRSLTQVEDAPVTEHTTHAALNGFAQHVTTREAAGRRFIVSGGRTE